jgi:predicted small metal-binding protein
VKKFSCGDVVPGCRRQFAAADESVLFAQIAAHARQDHGVMEISAELEEQVRASLVTV